MFFIYYCTFVFAGENKTLDKNPNENDFIADVSSMLVDNGLPAFGTKEFNDMCSNFFGERPKSN